MHKYHKRAHAFAGAEPDQRKHPGKVTPYLASTQHTARIYASAVALPKTKSSSVPSGFALLHFHSTPGLPTDFVRVGGARASAYAQLKKSIYNSTRL